MGNDRGGGTIEALRQVPRQNLATFKELPPPLGNDIIQKTGST